MGQRTEGSLVVDVENRASDSANAAYPIRGYDSRMSKLLLGSGTEHKHALNQEKSYQEKRSCHEEQGPSGPHRLSK